MPTVNAPPAVLVCDDTPAKRYVIASWLRRAGYRVVEAQTGGEAVALAQQAPVDLAVLDVHLPDMSGFDVCTAIKSNPATAATPVMHISAIAVDPQDRSAGLENGADAYMIDPIEPQELLSVVRSLLRSAGHRRSAERLASRLQQLAAASLRINIALSGHRLAMAAAEAAAWLFDTESVVLLDDTKGTALSRTDAAGVSTSADVPASVGSSLLHQLADVRVAHAADAPWSDVLQGSGYDGPWRIFPVRSGNEPAGLLAVPAPALAGEEDEMLIGRLAQTVSVAMGNLRVFVEEHRTALALQRSLLPAALPPLPGLTVAARYKASNEQAEVGGDFFDAFPTGQGDSLVVIGDVQGHSLEAAVVMAELRYSVRAYAHLGLRADEVLRRTNDLLLRNHPELTASLCLLVVAPDAATAAVANAGHLPPLVLSASGARYLDPGGMLLGVQPALEVPLESLTLPAGTRVLLMTDGLVERRGQDMSTALETLAEEVEKSAALTAEALCDHLMAGWGGSEDDVALVVVDTAGEPAPAAG